MVPIHVFCICVKEGKMMYMNTLLALCYPSERGTCSSRHRPRECQNVSSPKDDITMPILMVTLYMHHEDKSARIGYSVMMFMLYI